MFRKPALTSSSSGSAAVNPITKPGGKTNDLIGNPSNSGGAGLPMLGLINPNHLLVGNKVWVSDPKVLWRIGEVHAIALDQQTAQIYLPDAAEEKLQTLPLSTLYTFDASHVVDHEDIALMNNMHEAPLLNVLRQRFEMDKIYTFTADILLSINPYKTIPLLYDVVGFMEQHQSVDAGKRPPHLFTIAEKAYTGMKGVLPGTGTPQSIIVSGESGAGKTEASKYIMKYLATASKHAVASNTTTMSTTTAVAANAHTNVHERIEECVVLSNLILESFGNAKTSRNDNSSRFGKYIQIHYNPEGRMAGVSIRHFLLEKTRLVMPQANERNYHIFYQLLAGLKTLGSAEEKKLKLQENVWNYTYLTHGECVEVDGVDDRVEFEQLRTCLDQLGMDKTNFQMPMFEILAAILHLGNVQFEAMKPAGGGEEETTIVVFPESDEGVHLEHVSMLLGVNPTEFAKKMVTQTTITGRGSILEMKLTPEHAKNAMDAFCKYLYGELFHHLIARINACAKEQTTMSGQERAPPRKGPGGAPSAPAFIGILDIFGFEVMKKNSLEQLCINFTNETLQQQFNKHIFVLEQERYANEGIAFSIVEFKDNQSCLDLIQKPPTGLLPLLEEQMLLKRKTTDKQLLTIYHGNHLDKHPNYTKPRFECDEFVIRHYAGEVTYDIHDFIAKNTDNLHDDLLDLLKRSSQTLLQAMFSTSVDSKGPQKRVNAPVTPANNSGKRQQGTHLTGTTTVTSRFRTQLTELMDMLWNTTPNYIKCIKPNNLKFPGGFSCELVRDQLVYSGVLEVVRIRQEGFPIRKRFDVFYELFWSLAMRKYPVQTVRQNESKMLKEACEAIANEWLEGEKVSQKLDNNTKKVFAMGRNEVFLRYGQVEKLEAAVATLRYEQAVIIQSKLVRSRLAYKKYQLMKTGMTKLQARWRMYVLRKRFLGIMRASVRLQAQFRRYRLQTIFQRQKRAANTIFRVTLRHLTHKRFVVWAKQTKAAIRIQKHVRGFLSRTAAERARKLKERSALALQSWYRMITYRQAYTLQRKATIRIQALYRSVIMRREFLLRKKASIVLAAFVRQIIQHKKFKMLKQRIVKLQALVRMWRHQKLYQTIRKRVVYIQSKRRQKYAIGVKEKRMRAMVRLQHAMKGWICRCKYVAMKINVVVLQYLAKSWLLRKEFRRLRTSAKRIQTAWRKYHRVKCWETEIASLFRSSHSVAGTSWTTHTKMEESDRRTQKLRQNPSLFFNLRPKAFGYNTLFHHAAGCGDFHVIKYMLDQRVHAKDELLNMKNGKGNIAFHEACAHGQYDMIKLLALQMQALPEFEPQTPKSTVEKPKKPVHDSNGNNQNHENPENEARPSVQNGDIIPSSKVKEEEPEQDGGFMAPGIIYSGYLKKRRETSRWMRRFVVLCVNDTHYPQLEYYANDKPATLQKKSSKHIDLRVSLWKKSIDIPFAFEIHSPQLLEGRNKEGRLYFAAENEIEIQKWLAHLRNSIPSSIESRIFAMHRASKYGKLEFVDFAARKRVSNLTNESPGKATPLHLVSGVTITIPGSSSTSGSANFAGGENSNGSALEVAVTASAISVSTDDESNNNHSSSDTNNHPQKQRPQDCKSPEEIAIGKARLDHEADLVKAALWLIENGAEINAMTINQETPLKLALRANNLLVAKHLLDRGALATGLSTHEIEEVQRLKAALAKNAISSVGSSNYGGAGGSSSSLVGGSFIKKNNASVEKEMPLLFLLKQPGKIRHSSYVSVFVELIGISNPEYLSRPRIIISVVDSQRNLVEMKQQVSVQPMVLASSLVWSFTWHMQTPLENLPHGACVVFELTISPTISAALSTPASSAEDFVPVCWTYIQVDQRTANCMPLNAEMYKYPMDLTLKKLQRVDAFINGDVLISQGPQ